ncbi:MAG: hypothetical protein HDR56_07625 [Treponema sp.]|nr:hypothetical protein [Treponema sp.]
MKKKFLGFVAVLFLAGSTQLFAWGIGLQGGGVAGPYGVGGLAVTFGLDQVPLLFAVDMGFGWGFSIAATADYWIMNPTIMDWDWGAWKWHWGFGAAVGITAAPDFFTFDIGPRALIGMNLEFLKNTWSWLDHFEAFVQVAWQPMFCIGTDFVDRLGYNMLRFPLVTGLRMWF